mmetsp:Transcript_2652/g.3626  ORF Transcript_2652/g.3626 Transcript_2652/m.3626 type:complete len:463 (+) Transcript_2652:61-1449(+)
MFFISLTLLLYTLFSFDEKFVTAVAPIGSIPMKVTNNAGSAIEFFWVNTFEGKKKGEETLVPQNKKPLRNSSISTINSYNTHRFRVKFVDKSRTEEVDFVKGPAAEKVIITYDKESKQLKVKQITKFDEIMENISKGTEKCSHLRGDAFSECLSEDVAEEITQLSESKSTMVTYRDLMASRLRNYTCADETMETSTPIKTYTKVLQNKKYVVDVLLDAPHSKIWLVDDFISPEECEVFFEHGSTRLARATVAGEDGSSEISIHRRANQASYDFKLKDHPEEDPLWPLFNRVLDMVNYHAGYNLQPEGQEYFTIIQYNKDDEYTPHCDGSCDNNEYIKAGRVATAVLYCQVPEVGGATTFTKADIFVKPRAGMATFFSYKGPDGRMDDGYTEHSGCPVIEGEKWITTAWLREGVSAEDTSDNYDPEGIRILTADEYSAMGGGEEGFEEGEVEEMEVGMSGESD